MGGREGAKRREEKGKVGEEQRLPGVGVSVSVRSAGLQDLEQSDQGGESFLPWRGEQGRRKGGGRIGQ